MDNYQEKRNLDGMYFRVRRNNHWANVCVSDMTEAEFEDKFKGQTADYLFALARNLAKTLRELGDKLDITAG